MQPYNKNLELPSRDLHNNMTDAEECVWSRFGENKNTLNM
jgi:very-short-patch-repair endonuclease